MITSLNRMRVARRIGVLAAAVAWCLSAEGAQAAPKQPDERPQLLALVSAGPNGVDQVAVSYEGEVSEAKARAQLKSLLRATGWQATGIEVDSQRLAPNTPKMTSVSFTAPAVVPYPEGTLPVAPFIETYRDFAGMVLVFQLNRPFRLIGPAPYEDRHLEIRLQQGTGIYRYDVRIRDPRFGALHLPDIELPGTGGGTDGKGRKTPHPGLVIALALGAAASVSVAIYLLLAGRPPAKGIRPAR